LTGNTSSDRGTGSNRVEAKNRPVFVLRPFRAGDMGMIASRQSIFYRERYGWNKNIEVNEGEVTTAFLRNFKPGREQCWVAEVDGAFAGSIFLTDEGGALSRLRLLFVEPRFQGRGIGDALVSIPQIQSVPLAEAFRIVGWSGSMTDCL
jgi:GNAT superfamily N-acetyltransferase